ncbi:hypothetical protein L3Y34_009691 [Caenorhabditis briggsae]|uniref:DUF268 domain-containing protein n=1 Tax=Caenorhabditis briggsae TaxID=6238 RepID=A0AAE9A7T0_CAEBR|nr:hypothetical protein L3Y34_009691 [Caenorhabditis briggsae]
MFRLGSATRLSPSCVRFIPLFAVIFLLVISFTVFKSSGIEKYQERTNAPYVYINHRVGLSEPDLNEYSVKTHKGYVSLNELNEKVYRPFGYEISKPTLPVPTLKMLNEPTCELVFSEWLRISKEPQTDIPQKEIPIRQTDQFLLNGYAALGLYYFNDKNSGWGDKPRNWDRISEIMTYSKKQIANLAYPVESESMYNAMAASRLDNLTGVVVGSMQPWVEVYALKNGAKKILTVEYNKLTIQPEFQDRLSSILPVDFVRNWEKYAGTFDFAASFSSIEHSGLGRYGDPMDPIGDLREMLKIKCMLKPGGLLFLGMPYGTDAIQFNAHRIYGSIRLAMMFYGFEWLGTYSGENSESFDLNSARLHFKGVFGLTQYTMVLRKL